MKKTVVYYQSYLHVPTHKTIKRCLVLSLLQREATKIMIFLSRGNIINIKKEIIFFLTKEGRRPAVGCRPSKLDIKSSLNLLLRLSGRPEIWARVILSNSKLSLLESVGIGVVKSMVDVEVVGSLLVVSYLLA